MRFSEHFGVTPEGEDDWFDPLLSSDTPLFVDPFLIFQDETLEWEGAHDELIEFFNLVLQLVAKSQFAKGSAHWKAAERLLMFPEPAEFCLGMAQGSVRGSGAGSALRDEMLEGSVTAIRSGLTQVAHFEELTLFGPGVGVDRISDITCNVLKNRFIRYTTSIAERHGIEMNDVGVKHASWRPDFLRWNNAIVSLPQNPFLRTGVLLCPSRFLREIPVIEPGDFWDWSWSNHNEDLRSEFNYEIGRRVDAATLIRMARRHPGYVREYVSAKEIESAESYDFTKDTSFTRWYERGAEFVSASPFHAMTPSPDAFCRFVLDIVQNFKHGVEQTDSWRLLWDERGHPRNEQVVQALFRSVMLHYCRANNIDLSGEANAGRGPVDFKFSSGWSARAVTEIKLTSNSRYWHGLTRQTPQYLRSEEIRCGVFISVGFHDADFAGERSEQVRKAAEAVKERENVELHVVDVDARMKPSASRS